jgi:regulator of replication initiation timing
MDPGLSNILRSIATSTGDIRPPVIGRPSSDHQHLLSASTSNPHLVRTSTDRGHAEALIPCIAPSANVNYGGGHRDRQRLEQDRKDLELDNDRAWGEFDRMRKWKDRLHADNNVLQVENDGLRRDLEQATAREAEAQAEVRRLKERYEDVLRDKVMLAEQLSVSIGSVIYQFVALIAVLLSAFRALQPFLSKSCSTLPDSWPETTTTARCSTSASCPSGSMKSSSPSYTKRCRILTPQNCPLDGCSNCVCKPRERTSSHLNTMRGTSSQSECGTLSLTHETNGYTGSSSYQTPGAAPATIHVFPTFAQPFDFTHVEGRTGPSRQPRKRAIRPFKSKYPSRVRYVRTHCCPSYPVLLNGSTIENQSNTTRSEELSGSTSGRTGPYDRASPEMVRSLSEIWSTGVLSARPRMALNTRRSANRFDNSSTFFPLSRQNGRTVVQEASPVLRLPSCLSSRVTRNLMLG